MNALVHALGWTLLHFLWQGALLGGAAALVLWILEGRSSRLRHGMACLALLLMTAAPPLTFLRVRETAPVQVQAPAGPPRTPAAPAPGRTVPVEGAHLLDRSLPWIVLLWASGSLALSLRLAGGWVWLQHLRRRRDTVPADDASQLRLLRLCQRMGVGSNLRLLLCRSVPGPTVLGWLRPVILIPPALLAGLDPLHLECILAHELAHVLRHDALVNLLQSVAEILFFFHPAVWWVSARIRQEREQAADDLAVRLQEDPLDYAQALTLLEALASGIRPTPPRLALGAQGGDFMSRIHRLISPTAPASLAPRAGLAVLLLLLGGGLALQARHRAEPPAREAEAPLPRGTVRLRRYDVDMDAPEGRAKGGTVDMRAEAVTLMAMEDALARLQELPPNPAAGFVDLETVANAAVQGPRFRFKFTAVEPWRILAIIRGQAARVPREGGEVREGQLLLQRSNAFTPRGGLLPRGLNLDLKAVSMPAAQVLQALDDLEALAPTPGIPQEIRREVLPGASGDPTVTLDLSGVDPLQLRATVEKLVPRP